MIIFIWYLQFKSRPTRPSPPFFAFVAASIGRNSEIGMAGKLWRAHEEEFAKPKVFIVVLLFLMLL